MARDWEEELAKLVGDPLAFQIGYRVRDAQKHGQQLSDDARQMLSEYLRYELDLIPNQSELIEFNQNLAELTARFEQIEQRCHTLFES